MKEYFIIIRADNFSAERTLFAPNWAKLQTMLYAYCIERGAKSFKWNIKPKKS